MLEGLNSKASGVMIVTNCVYYRHLLGKIDNEMGVVWMVFKGLKLIIITCEVERHDYVNVVLPSADNAIHRKYIKVVQTTKNDNTVN